MSIEFLLTSLIVVLMPGAGVLYTLAYGLSQGFRASIVAAFGCTLGIVPAACASIIGLAALLHTSALAFQAMKVIGVLYLLYMAWGILRDDGALELSSRSANTHHSQIALNGFLLNILNPKLSVFFLAFLPQFVSPDSASSTTQLASLALVFMGMTFLVFVAYGACAAIARDYVIARPAVMRWTRRAFAGSFGFLGAKLAVSEH